MMNDLLKRLKSAIKPLPISTPRILTTLLLAFTLMQVITVRAESSLAILPSPQVKLRSVSGSTISFFDANGAISNQNQSESRTLPRMVLFRNGKLTEPHERTLVVEFSRLVMPPSGGYISIEVCTQTGVNTPEQDIQKCILAWQEQKWITPSLNGETPG
jgi:hypothetical protein